MAIVKAEMVFNQAAGFSADELERIRTAAGRRTISFCEPSARRAQDNIERMITEYGKGKSAEDAGKQFGYSRRAVFYYLNRERIMVKGTEVLLAEKVIDWRARGLSWREIGRVLGVSHEAARRAAGVKETGTTTD